VCRGEIEPTNASGRTDPSRTGTERTISICRVTDRCNQETRKKREREEEIDDKGGCVGKKEAELGLALV
jgi:hypothetical protein